MVYTGATEEKTSQVTSAVTMNSDRAAAKPLHNFSLSWDLKWGNQRHHRCMKVEDSDRFDRRSAPGRSRRREPEAGFERRSRPRMEEGIEAVREKLMFEFKTAADKIKHAIFRSQPAAEDDFIEVIPPAAPLAMSSVLDDVAKVAAVRPWNLRTRRAACKSPIGGGGKGLKNEERSEGNNNNGGGKSPGSGQERPSFSITLSRKEVDEDFKVMLGHRAPRRPKKRPRAVQKKLDALFPGMWLTEVSADSYKVPGVPKL